MGSAAALSFAPLRQALLESVRVELDEQRVRDEAAASERIAKARELAENLVAERRFEGERAASREAAGIRAAAVRSAREVRLRAQRGLVDELRSRALQAVLELRGDPRYGALLDRLADTARSQLGSDVEIERDPPGVGGVLAHSGARTVDYTLPSIVERTIDGLGTELETLWR